MGLINMLVKKNDKLGNDLKNAAINPGFRPKFYKYLLEADIYVLVRGKRDLPNGEARLMSNKNIQVLNWEKSDGELITPIFSSEKEVRKAARNVGIYMRVNAKVLFNSNPEAHYVINPLSDYGKELTPYEVKSLLDGSLLNSKNEIKLEKGTKILLGQPKDYPHDLVKALFTYFEQNGEICNAYVAQMHSYEKNEEPHLLLALESSADLSGIFSEISIIIRDTLSSDRYVDMLQIGRGDEIDNYFREIKPFYRA